MIDSRPGIDRLRGYRAAIQALGLAYRDDYVALRRLLRRVRRARRPSACSRSPSRRPRSSPPSDLMAIGAIRAAAEAGLRVPEDLAVVGFDDIQLAPHVNPPLTTLRQDKLGLGAAAGDALVARIAGDPDRPSLRTLPVELVVRGSTAAPAG